MTTPALVIAEAKKHLGYVEGKNKDNTFGKWYGSNGSAWCAAFVSYVLNHTGNGALIKGAQTAKGFNSCGAGIKFFKGKKAWFAVKDAKPGDIVFFDWDHDGEQDHVGIVVSNDPKTKTVKTIEGNTSDSNHSNGGVVMAKTRNYSVLMGVGRPAYSGAAQAPVETLKAAPAPVSAPAKAEAPKATETKPASKTYTVKPGDSYWAIAAANPIPSMATSEVTKILQKLNGNKPLHPGDKILIK